MKRTALTTGGALALLLTAPGAAWAQSPPPFADRAPDPRGQQQQRGTTAELAPLPNWSIKQEVQRLDTSMREYNSLINSLSNASNELKEELQRYSQDPHNEVLASSLDNKMAHYAKRVMADFNGIIADQDVLSANFNDLQRKLVVFSRHLASQADGFRGNLDGYRGTAREVEKRLTELAVRLKENPPDDPNELRTLKREFSKEFRRYQLQMRYVNGYSRRYQSYQNLQRNVERLATLFVTLHEKFNELIDNLQNERQFLQDSVRLQADTLRIKQMMREGILGSEQAIGNVADKLATLYEKVDAFAQVQDRISTDLNRFVESQGVLNDIMGRIDKIGQTGGPIGDIGNDMEKAIDAFYGRRSGLDGGLLGDQAPDEMMDFGLGEDE
ncbi:MAG: hypothetical protein KF878_29185 [Planctomycetes bacterium]|nr:hypothetical protein [Planctomycetota bacterium]